MPSKRKVFAVLGNAATSSTTNPRVAMFPSSAGDKSISTTDRPLVLQNSTKAQDCSTSSIECAETLIDIYIHVLTIPLIRPLE